MAASGAASKPRSYEVGELVVHLVPETVLPPQTGAWLLPDATPERVTEVDWLGEPWTDPDHRLRLSTHVFAVQVDGQRILVDAGIGNGKTHDNPAFNDLDTDFLDHLAGIGFTPDAVDLVVLTHLHADHVGWCTRHDGQRWVPTFPNARHLVSRTESDYWAHTEVEASRRRMFDDSAVPVERAGLLDLLDVPVDGVEVAAGVRMVATPGHTPGHVSVRITSAGRSALVTGDAVHHPVQGAFPELCSAVDVDPPAAVRTRRALLTRAHDTGELLLGTHFPTPSAARVRAAGDTYSFEADDGTS